VFSLLKMTVFFGGGERPPASVIFDPKLRPCMDNHRIHESAN
jgi:hypothetical protein